jgi:hypothetical protein
MGKSANRTFIGAVKSYGLGLILFLAILLIMLRGLTSTEEASYSEQARMLNDSIRRAMVTCYAMEGSYPESVQYMVDNYGVRVDESKFTVFYYAFASNIMPDYDVIAKS